jgi:hypothetical protein
MRTTVQQQTGDALGHVTTDICPLCGDMDGGQYIASGCKKLKNMYTARHNQAGRTILKAILKGERAAEIELTDLGSTDNLAKDRGGTVIHWGSTPRTRDPP